MASKPRRYHPTFADDLSAAVGYYDGISPDLGNRFREAVREKLRMISENPEIYAKIFDDNRAARINRFPYVVVYRDHSELVAVVAVKHAASDPATWLPTD